MELAAFEKGGEKKNALRTMCRGIKANENGRKQYSKELIRCLQI
jgi:hypothetical protein